MPKNHVLRVLMTEEQYQKLKQTALVMGHGSLSSYIRELAFSAKCIEEKINMVLFKLERWENGR